MSVFEYVYMTMYSTSSKSWQRVQAGELSQLEQRRWYDTLAHKRHTLTHTTHSHTHDTLSHTRHTLTHTTHSHTHDTLSHTRHTLTHTTHDLHTCDTLAHVWHTRSHTSTHVTHFHTCTHMTHSHTYETPPYVRHMDTIQVSLVNLCNGDLDAPLQLECWDYDGAVFGLGSSTDDMIGLSLSLPLNLSRSLWCDSVFWCG